MRDATDACASGLMNRLCSHSGFRAGPTFVHPIWLLSALLLTCWLAGPPVAAQPLAPFVPPQELSMAQVGLRAHSAEPWTIVSLPGLRWAISEPAPWDEVAAELRKLLPDNRTQGLDLWLSVPDPAHPLGHQAFGPTRMVLAQTEPRIQRIHPNHGPVGQSVQLLTTGDESRTGPGAIVFATGDPIGRVARRIHSGSYELRTDASFLPGQVRLGPPVGWTASPSDRLDSWFQPTHLPVEVIPNGITPIPGAATVRNTLSVPGASHSFVIAGPRGASLSAYAFALSGSELDARLIDPALDSRGSSLRLRLLQWPSLRLIRESRIDGPGHNPALLLKLPATGTYHLELHREGQPGLGNYMLDVVLNDELAPRQRPLVCQLTPQVGRPGDWIDVTGAFFESNTEVLVSGVAVPARVISSRHLQMRIPAAALSGPVQVRTQHGLSDYLPDDVSHHLVVLPEAPRAIPSGRIVTKSASIVGQLIPGGLARFQLALEAGEDVMVAAYATTNLGQMLAGSLPSLVNGPRLTLMVEDDLGILFSDQDSGPGDHPAIGMSKRFPFTAKAKGTYTFTIIDQGEVGGDFLLVFTDPHSPGGDVPLLSVPIHVHILVDALSDLPSIEQSALAAQIEKLSVWNQAGIVAHIVQTEGMTVGPDLFSLDDTNEILQLMALASDTDAIDVFIAHGLPRGVGGTTTMGLTWMPTGQIFLNGSALQDPKARSLPLTLAHELGHAIASLRDEGHNERDNLMHMDSDRQTAGKLSLLQVNRARYLPSELRPNQTRIQSHPLRIAIAPEDSDAVGSWR